MVINSKVNPASIPDTTQAEKWLSADVFLFKGHVWEIQPNGMIRPVINRKKR